jgi:CBS domain containing-hemolysin-like protein
MSRLELEDGPSQNFGRRLKTFFKRFRNHRSVGKFEEEIQDLIDHGAEQGVITPGEGEMIHSIFELGETVAREIMIPRTSIVAARIDATIGQVLELVLTQGHSRIPIYEKDVDHVVGVLHVKDILSYWGMSGEDHLPREAIRVPIFVHETKKIMEILAELRAQKSHMAIVLDEYGGTAGLVTLEDIIEEIVGDIHDEYDVEEESITQIENGTFLVDARFNLEELEDFLKVELPEGDYETLGGFIIDLTGRVPQENEYLEYQNLLMTIRSADERKINQVEIKILVPGQAAGSGST